MRRTSLRAKNHPDIKDDRSKGVLFGEVGSTGWGRIRRLGDYKGNKKEGDFSHLHDRFWSPGDDAV
jgi:hypothetical protein